MANMMKLFVLQIFITEHMSIDCRILGISTNELQEQFDLELQGNLKQPESRPRNFLEFCSFKALYLAITRPNCLNDKELRHLTFDMMIAWEIPGVDCDLIDRVRWNSASFSWIMLEHVSRRCSSQVHS